MKNKIKLLILFYYFQFFHIKRHKSVFWKNGALRFSQKRDLESSISELGRELTRPELILSRSLVDSESDACRQGTAPNSPLLLPHCYQFLPVGEPDWKPPLTHHLTLEEEPQEQWSKEMEAEMMSWWHLIRAVGSVSMMLGTVQLGVLAACIVLFVPMGMAGWHLSRNKMLFFSGALFISLAVGVHLSPYFPSITDFISSSSTYSSSSSSPSIDSGNNRDSCLSLLHEIYFDVEPVRSINGSVYYLKSWRWPQSGAVSECGFQKLGRPHVSDLLNGSWVVVAGDSQARLMALALLNLVLESERMDSIRGDLFKRHSNYQIVVSEIGMKLDFIWAPFVSNLTDLMGEFKQYSNYPDVLVMGSGLWHMLHFHNASDYGFSLELLKGSVTSLLPLSPELGDDGPVTGSVSFRSPPFFWLGMPMLINSMLNTEEKRERMNDAAFNTYETELRESKILQEFGGPLLLLDIHSLTQDCGRRCTEDGMHYDAVVYNAAIHIMLNALLIESHQKLWRNGFGDTIRLFCLVNLLSIVIKWRALSPVLQHAKQKNGFSHLLSRFSLLLYRFFLNVN